MQFIDLSRQYEHLSEKIDNRIKQVFKHGSYIMGPEVLELERKLEEYVGVKNCITCGNGTDALQLALMALNIGPGDVVFTSPFTFFATAEAISIVGAKPIFVDIDPLTYNISPTLLEEAIQNFNYSCGLTPKAVIAVDLFGLPADYEKLEPLCKLHGLKLIEDAAQGFGGQIKARKAGSFGDIATTSFFPAKPLGCYGDGGALFTDDDAIADKLKSLRVHGKGVDKYDNVRIGLNSRLDTIQAAILLEKLAVFPDELQSRDRIAKMYNEEILLNVNLPVVPDSFVSSWAQYSILTASDEDRTKLRKYLKLKGIPTNVYYPKPLHKSEAYINQYKDVVCNVSEKISNTIISLPMSPYLSSKEIMEITTSLNTWVYDEI